MKELSKSEIYQSVRAFLDELGENDAEFILSDKDSSELNTIIEEVTPLAVRNVHIGAPYWMLDGESLVDSNSGGGGGSLEQTPSDPLAPIKGTLTVDTTTLKGSVTLPNDFMRLVKVQLSSWGAPVTNVITEDSPEYRMQANQYMRGTHYKPVCALVLLANSLQGLELFSAKETTDTLKSLIILREPEWANDAIKVCPKLVDSVIAQITGQTLLALGENQRAETFLTLSNNYLQ